MVKTLAGNLTLASDIHFSTFKFQICLGMVIYNKNAYSTHIVGGSILAGDNLTSFYIVPGSSYSSNKASSSLLVAWYLNCSSAASSTKSKLRKTCTLKEAATGRHSQYYFSSYLLETKTIQKTLITIIFETENGKVAYQ